MGNRFRVVIAVLALSLIALAHGKPQTFMGTVKELSATRIVITTTLGEVRTFEITPRTKFVKSGTNATAKDLSVGERVVVEADVHEGKGIAEVIKFGKPPQAHEH